MFSKHFDHTSYIFDKNPGDFAKIQQETDLLQKQLPGTEACKIISVFPAQKLSLLYQNLAQPQQQLIKSAKLLKAEDFWWFAVILCCGLLLTQLELPPCFRL